MSKKRVHEIAKELKDSHQIELDNKAVVTELVSLGYDVKSHSSSLEDDQAVEAVRRIVEKRKPKAPPAPVAPKGFVVRRKVGETVQSTVMAPAAHGQLPAAPPAPSAPAAETPAVELAPPPALADTAEIAAPAPLPPADAPAAVAAAPSAPRAAPPVEPEVSAVPAPVAPEAPSIAAAPAVSVPSPVVTAPAATEKPTVVSVSVAPAQTTAPIPVPRPSSGRVTIRPASMQQAPNPSGATVPPGGRLPLGPAAVLRPGALRPALSGPPRTVPTATQAVLVSRPLIVVKRVTPTAPNRNYPMAPGKKAIGDVREFKVVPNQFGPGRDLAEARRKEAEKKGAGKRSSTEKEQVAVTDMRELMFGRVSIPIRGKKRKPTKKGQKTLITQMAEEKKVIKIQEGISVSELSQRMGVRTIDIIKKMMAGGKMATANQMIDVDTATIIAADFKWTVKKVGFEVEDFLPKLGDDKPEDYTSRPPVVTVMGHVDHGKTSLLDAIRSADVAAGEAGGITQRIGAYSVRSSQGDITFMDTPGHEAFRAMRSRGANLTDVVVLVVAADDGVMPQTKEAIEHAKTAEVPIVVAVNKMDLPGANIDRVKKELADLGLLAEDWGGDTIMVPVSAKTRMGLDLLLENISLQAEVLELKANSDRPAQGVVLEAYLEKGRGPIATVLVQEGTLRKGDAMVTGTHSGRVRMMTNDKGELIDELHPGYSAEVIGLSGVPSAGDVIHAVADEKAAKQIVDHRLLKQRQAEAGKTSRETLTDLLNKQKVADQKELKIVLKADVSGSLEACAESIAKLSTPKVKVSIVQKSVGMMTETDINNAAAFEAVIIGFNSKPESGAEAAAKVHGVKWATYNIIYELLAAVVTQMEDLLEPIRVEKKLGKAEVRNLFNVPKLGVVAGSSVLEGSIKRSAFLRLMRQNKQVFQGKVASLKRFKEDVKEVATGFECGIGIDGFSAIEPGDIIEAFEIEEIRPSLN
jgi:translation initiation factor IF-2